jgi:hypothetical protein
MEALEGLSVVVEDVGGSVEAAPAMKLKHSDSYTSLEVMITSHFSHHNSGQQKSVRKNPENKFLTVSETYSAEGKLV